MTDATGYCAGRIGNPQPPIVTPPWHATGALTEDGVGSSARPKGSACKSIGTRRFGDMSRCAPTSHRSIEETAPNKEHKTKRYNRVNPTESRGGRIPLVSPREQRPKSLEGRGWMKQRMQVCNGLDRGSKFAPEGKQ